MGGGDQTFLGILNPDPAAQAFFILVGGFFCVTNGHFLHNSVFPLFPPPPKIWKLN